MFLIIDDFLEDELVDEFKPICEKYWFYLDELQKFDVGTINSYFPQNREIACTIFNEKEIEFLQHYFSKLHEVTKPYISEYDGVELWFNVNNSIDWHIDRDEEHAYSEDKLRLTDLSTVFYPHVNVNDPYTGRFLFIQDPHLYKTKPKGTFPVPYEFVTHVTPMRNRLIVFSTGTYHRIEDFDGERVSVAVNYWKEPIKIL